MELLPAMRWGWLNGWLMLSAFYLVFGILLLAFPRDIRAQLFDMSGWKRKHRILSAIGKLFALACLILIVLTPLKIGQGVFVVGMTVFVPGFVGMSSALWDYRNTPADHPVTRGLYRVSRNPQWVMLAMMFLGTSIAIGSWAAVMLFLASAGFYHFRILGEENACVTQYGASYRQYMTRVPRYLPFFPLMRRNR